MPTLAAAPPSTVWFVWFVWLWFASPRFVSLDLFEDVVWCFLKKDYLFLLSCVCVCVCCRTAIPLLPLCVCLSACLFALVQRSGGEKSKCFVFLERCVERVYVCVFVRELCVCCVRALDASSYPPVSPSTCAHFFFFCVLFWLPCVWLCTWLSPLCASFLPSLPFHCSCLLLNPPFWLWLWC
jgi:hypothetical protein